MSKLSFKKRIYLKGKESAIVWFILIFALIIFIIPVLGIFFVRFVYQQIIKIRKKATNQAEIEASYLLNSRVE